MLVANILPHDHRVGMGVRRIQCNILVNDPDIYVAVCEGIVHIQAAYPNRSVETNAGLVPA